MDCDRFINEKILEAHGELEASSAFRQHLEACPDCAEDIEDVRQIAGEYRSASQEKIPGSVRFRRPLRSRFRDFALPALAAAVMMALLLIPLFSPKETAKAPLDSAKIVQKNTEPVEASGLTIDEKIVADRQRTLEWDASEARVDYELRSLRHDVEFLELTNDGM